MLMKPMLMRGSSPLPSAAALSLSFRNPSSLSTNLRYLSLSSSPSLPAASLPPPTPSAFQVQTPLFLRPSTHAGTLSGLRKWNNWAKNLASSVASTLSAADGGPDSAHLLRELKWLVEDALDDPTSSILPHLQFLSVSQDVEDEPIRLRAPLEELYVLWKQRIEERRPFQYIVGCEHWRDLVLSVQEGVLIPRPETELLVDLVGDAFSKNKGLKEGLWADLGTGSGAIAIGIGRVLGAQGRVIATDLSPVAVAVASYNVQRYGLQDMIDIRRGSWFEPLDDVEGKLAGLVSNPPYIPSEHISGLQAEVGRHEPRLALDGGVNGMDSLLHLCSQAALMLKSGGFFAFETNGEEQLVFLVNYLRNELGNSFCNVNTVPDFAGIRRFVTGLAECRRYMDSAQCWRDGCKDMFYRASR